MRDRVSSQVAWWLAFVENLEWYDKSNIRKCSYKCSVRSLGHIVFPVAFCSRDKEIRTLRVVNKQYTEL